MAKWKADKTLAKKKIQVLMVAKSKTGMTEEEYRSLLGSFGLTSTKQLNDGQFDELMDHFRVLGFETKSGEKYRKLANAPAPKDRYMAKIDAIRRDMGLPWSYVDGMARQAFGLDSVQWAPPGELFKVMQMMIMHQRRQWDKGGGR